MTIKKLEAIFTPFLSIATAGYILVLCAIVIGLSAFFLPAQEIIHFPIYIIPDALAMAKQSDFPFALSVAYSMSVYLSLACVLMTGFTKGNLKGLEKIRESQSVLFRVVSALLIAIYIGFLLTQEFIPINSQQFSYTFFARVPNDRFFAFIWVEGVFIFTYITALIGMFDLSVFIKKMSSIERK